jgi:hypothetical protein
MLKNKEIYLEKTLQTITPADMAARLNKSLRWVYGHAHELGGARIGGSWIFTEEGLANAIKGGREVACSRKNEGGTGNETVRGKERSTQLGIGNKKAAQRDPGIAAEAARLGLVDLCNKISGQCRTVIQQEDVSGKTISMQAYACRMGG